MAYLRVHNKGVLWRQEEAEAATIISPGMLCEIVADARVSYHKLEGGNAERLIAQEDALQGHGVDTNYAIGDNVQLALAVPGEVFNMLIQSGQAADPGEEVISAGDGTLIVIGSQNSAAGTVQTIGRIDPSEPTFTTLAANTLKAVRLV